MHLGIFMVFLGQAGGKHHLLVATIMQVPLFMAILVIEIISPLHLLLFPIILVFLFLSNIADEYGELYATHFVREVTGMSLRDTEEGCIDLPSHFSKRHFYAQYCYHQGYKVKANAKGSYDSMSEYKLQVLMIRYGPRAVSPSPFAHGSIFSAYGKQNFTS